MSIEPKGMVLFLLGAMIVMLGIALRSGNPAFMTLAGAFLAIALILTVLRWRDL